MTGRDEDARSFVEFAVDLLPAVKLQHEAQKQGLLVVKGRVQELEQSMEHTAT